MNQRIYSMPEVEKTTAWKDRKEPQIELRDAELESALKRTALIQERMSPPGALHLPPLLEAHRQKYGIPDGFFKSQASFDRIYVFPIDPFDNDDKITPGSFLFRANTTKMKDMQEGHRGVLISAGLIAADRLMSHGIELGHIVTTNKNVPFARRCEVLQDGHQMFYLVMREADLAGSETLAEEILAGKKKTVEVGDETGYQHVIASNDNGTWTTRKKMSVYLNDAW
jgi:hypothetical protein